MYLGFFAWYRGLALAGIARGGQVQQLQALLTLAWSALLLREHVTRVMVL
jgi:drug/metabolite transporter (DMT)-like permease